MGCTLFLNSIKLVHIFITCTEVYIHKKKKNTQFVILITHVTIKLFLITNYQLHIEKYN